LLIDRFPAGIGGDPHVDSVDYFLQHRLGGSRKHMKIVRHLIWLG